ncbi:MAG: hypothetical protein QXD32_00400 [Nitrososphaerota archaeon]
MAQPSIRTGLAITLAGVALIAIATFLEYAARAGWLILLAGWFPALLNILQFDLGPAVTSFGVGWAVSGLHPMRKWYLYPAVGGLLLATSSFAASILLRPEPILYTAITLSLTWSAGPALLASGVVAGVLVNIRASRHGVKPPPNPHENELDTFVIAALYMPLLPLITDTAFYLRYVVPVILTWLFWHMLADRFTAYLLTRRVRKGGGHIMLVAVEPPSPEETTLMNVVSRSYYPMAFGLGITTTVASVLDLLNIQVFGGDPFSAAAGASVASIAAIAAGSLYVGPVLWLYEDLGVRVFDRAGNVIRRPAIHSFAEEMVEIYTFIFSPIGFTFAVANGDLPLALILLGLVFHLLFTVSITSTYLYIRFSAKKHLEKVLNKLEKNGALVKQYR